MAQSTTAIRTAKRDVPFFWEGKDKRGNGTAGATVTLTMDGSCTSPGSMASVTPSTATAWP